MYENEFGKIFELAKGKVDDIEILLSASTSFSVRINNQEVETFSHSDSKGIGVRVIVNGKVGYAFTEEFADSAFEMIINEAAANAKVIEKEEEAIMADYPNIDAELDLFNDDLAKVPVSEKIELAKSLERIAKAQDERVLNTPYCGYGDGESYVKIANSKGLNKEYKVNYCSAYVYALVANGDERKMAGESKLAHDFKEIDADKIAKKAVEKAVQLFNGEKLETGVYPVVFNQEMMASMLGTFCGVFNAKSVQEGRSLLIGKLGQKIASDLVTIVDDGLYKGGFGTSPFDGEGYPNQRTVLIDKGVLKTYMHNTETARKDGVESTGNGSRGYKSSLTISPTNFIMQKGEISKEDLFKKHDKVVEIVSLQGAHSGANPISGDFSLGAEGFLWENGERKHALKNFIVSGNFLQMLQDVEAIANDFDFSGGAIGSSATLIKGLALSS